MRDHFFLNFVLPTDIFRYGTSIEGGIESDKPLAVVKKGKAHAKAEDPNKKSAKGVQIQRENIMKRFKESQEELMKKYKGLKEDATDDKVAECADLFEKKYKEIRKDIEQVGEVKLNKKEKKGARKTPWTLKSRPSLRRISSRST